MDMTLNLTYREGMNVMEALSETARKLGRDDDFATREEYCAVLDAGLTALGIHVSIDTEPESDDDYDDYDDYDDEDEDEEDDTELNSVIDELVNSIADDLCELWGA